eukprot:6767249-Prymnesium_polylepis.1
MAAEVCCVILRRILQTNALRLYLHGVVNTTRGHSTRRTADSASHLPDGCHLPGPADTTRLHSFTIPLPQCR